MRNWAPWAASLAALIALPASPASPPAEIAGWYERIPAPPRSVAEAASKTKVTAGQEFICSDPAVIAFERDFQEHATALHQAADDASDPGAAIASAMQKKMEEMQQKMQGMTPKQQQAYAQQLQQEMMQLQMQMMNPQARAERPDPRAGELPEVLKALDALRGRHFEEDHAASVLEQFHEGHAQIDARHKSTSGACYEEHVALVGRQLAELQGPWARMRDDARKQAAEVDRILAPVQYGDRAKNAENKAKLVGYQQQALALAGGLFRVTQAACVHGAIWSKSREVASSKTPPPWMRHCGPAPAGRDYTSQPR